MNEVSIVIDGQRSAGEQQRSNHAGQKAEHLHRCAKQQNRQSPSQHRGQTQIRLCEIGKSRCTLQPGQRQRERGQHGPMSVP